MHLDEAFSWLHLRPHEDVEYLICFFRILNRHQLYESRLGIHGRLPELLRVHLAQTLISLDIHLRFGFCRLVILVAFYLFLLLRAGGDRNFPDFLFCRLKLCVGEDILERLAALYAIEWRLRDIDMTARDKFG